MGDPYLTDVHRWWHLSEPSPELLSAEAAGLLGARGTVADLGCGLGTDIGYLARQGWRTVGVDLSMPALSGAHSMHTNTRFVRAELTRLPLPTSGIDLLLDRGCFHYLRAAARAGYAHEAERVLSPSGRFFLRACVQTAGVDNGLDERAIRSTFASWRVVIMQRGEITSDTRQLPAIVAMLRPPPPRRS